jgi:hypothetical protein
VQPIGEYWDAAGGYDLPQIIIGCIRAALLSLRRPLGDEVLILPFSYAAG